MLPNKWVCLGCLHARACKCIATICEQHESKYVHMQPVEWVVWGQCCEWGLISVQSGELQMHQLCWKIFSTESEWSSFLQHTSSLLFNVLKGLFGFDHLDGNQYNRGWGQTSEITAGAPLRPGPCVHDFSRDQ